MMMVPRRRGILMAIFGGLDAKTVTMLLMGLMGVAGSGVALKRGSDTEQEVYDIVAVADSSFLADSIRDAKIDSLRVEVERLKAKLGRANVAQRELVRLRKRAAKPWWKLWG